MKKITLKNILIVLLVILVIMQFFTIDKTNPAIDPTKDFIAITQPDADISMIMKSACYDCHSNTTEYPWYSNIAPVSWWIKDHINHGKGHLNFSEWGDYPADKQDHKLEEFYEEVEEGEMPLNSYTWIHSEAQLTQDQRDRLVSWVKELRSQY